MADTDTTKALTAEEERAQRAAAKLLGQTVLPEGMLAKIFATLDARVDAARADLAALQQVIDQQAEQLRQERDAQDTAFDSLRQRHVAARARIEALEAGLRKIANYPYQYGQRIQKLRAMARALLTPVEAPSDVHPQGE